MSARLVAMLALCLAGAVLPAGPPAAAVGLAAGPVGPEILDATLDTALFHPASDGYRDVVTVRAFSAGAETATTTLRMVHATTDEEVLEPVTTAGSAYHLVATWDGLTGAGERAPAGTWTAHLDSVDPSGNESHVVVGDVRLTWRELVPVRQVGTLMARRALETTSRSACAQVTRRTPEWRDGARLQSHPCASRGVTAGFEARPGLPRGWVRGTVTVRGYGRSTRTGPHHAPGPARIRMHDSSGLPTGSTATLRRAEGWYDAPSLGWRSAVQHGQVHWQVSAEPGVRYDLRSFRVVLEGVALR
jgi:hypothetical protein